MATGDQERGRGGNGKNRGNSSYSSYYVENDERHWTSWLVPMFVVANIAFFFVVVVVMYVNNCPGNNLGFEGRCLVRFLGRLSFQPLKENPLFGPSANTNYHAWARSMRMALISKNKFQFVDGSIKESRDDDVRFPAWVKCNNLVLSWLQRAITPEIAQEVIWIDTASELWTDLFDRFNQGDLLRVSDLLQDFYNLQQGYQSLEDDWYS